MFEPETVIEQLLEGEVFELVLVLHLDLNDLVFVHILEPDVVFAQVDEGYAVVVFQVLGKDEQVLAVQSLIPERQLDQLVRLDVMERHVASIDGQLLDPVLKHKLS